MWIMATRTFATITDLYYDADIRMRSVGAYNPPNGGLEIIVALGSPLGTSWLRCTRMQTAAEPLDRVKHRNVIRLECGSEIFLL